MERYAARVEASGPPGPDRRVLAAFLAIIVLGGSNAVSIKIGNVELPPFWGATIRFGLATVILAGIALVARPPWPRGRNLVGAVIYGLIGLAASNAFAYLGLVDAPAGVAGVLIAVAPLLTLLLAVGQRLEKFRWQGLAGSVWQPRESPSSSATSLARRFRSCPCSYCSEPLFASPRRVWLQS